MDVNQECQCGEILEEDSNEGLVSITNLANKIVGGNPAEKHSIPWQVGIAELAISQSPFCGGTIIGPRTILSGMYLLRLLNLRLALITLLLPDTLDLRRGQNFLQNNLSFIYSKLIAVTD